MSLGELATAEPGRRAVDAQNKEREPCGLFSAGAACSHGSRVLVGLTCSWVSRAMGHAYSWVTHTWVTRAVLEGPRVALNRFVSKGR